MKEILSKSFHLFTSFSLSLCSLHQITLKLLEHCLNLEKPQKTLEKLKKTLSRNAVEQTSGKGVKETVQHNSSNLFEILWTDTEAQISLSRQEDIEEISLSHNIVTVIITRNFTNLMQRQSKKVKRVHELLK